MNLNTKDQKQKKSGNKTWGIVCAFVMVVAAVYSFSVHMGIMDDLGYAIHGYMGYIQYAKYGYWKWTSRIVIEVMASVLAEHTILWRIGNILVYGIAVVTLGYLAGLKTKIQYCFLGGSVLLYTFCDMESAGWIASTMNYLWPCVAMLLSLCPLRKLYDGEKLNVLDWGIALSASVFATNQEQAAGMFAIVLVSYFILYFRKEKRIPWIVLAQGLICGANIALVLICPGNDLRVYLETTNSPGFENYTIVDQGFAGVIRFFDQYLITFQPLVAVFAIVLFLVVRTNKESQWKDRLIAILPILIQGIGYMIGCFGLYKRHENFEKITYTSIATWLPIVVLVIWVVAVMYSIWKWLEYSIEEKIWIYSVCVSGVASIVILGLSPTLYRSLVRTNLFCLFVFMYVVNILFKQLDRNTEQMEKWKKCIFAMLFLVTIVGVIANNAYVCITTIV